LKIEFKHTVPLPLKSQNLDKSMVWDSMLLLEPGNNFLVKSDSGKGKSTFISYCYGLRNDFEGEIFINGENLNTISLDQWSIIRKNQLSIVPQDLKLFPEMTSMENLMIKNHLTGHKKENEINEMLELMNMLDFKDQKANTLSLGQQQRISLIRGLLQPFEILLMDEPFSHIDENNIEKAMQLIENECSSQSARYIMTSLGYEYNLSNVEIINL